MSAIDALATASAAGVTITLDRDGLILEAPKLPPDVVALLKSVKPDLLRVLAVRKAAQAALAARPPADCPKSKGRGAARPRTLHCRGLGRSGSAAQLDVGRALSPPALVEPHRSDRRGVARRLSAGDGDDCRKHRYQIAVGVAAQVPPHRPGASGMTFLCFLCSAVSGG